MIKIKKLFTIVSVFIFSVCCICCPIKQMLEDTPSVDETIIEEVVPEQKIESPKVEEPVEIVKEEPKVTEPVIIPEPPKKEVEVPKEEPKKEDDDEYRRSINDIEVSKEEFNYDKTAILHIIEELSTIMETKDFKNWLNYIEPSSKKYYSNITNLKKAQKKLPNKGIALNNIEDYFKYVFIPSRKRSRVDEIRYISKDSIKAVQVKDDKSIVVYYYFTKVDGKWLVHLPPIS